MADSADRRVSERYAVSGDTTCDFGSPVLEDFGAVRIKNISAHGIGVVTSQPIAEDMVMVLKLVNAKKKFTKAVLMRVTHVTPQSGGTYLVGGVLDTPLTYEELTRLVM